MNGSAAGLRANAGCGTTKRQQMKAFAMQGRSDTGQMMNTEQGSAQKLVLDTTGRNKTSLQIHIVQI